MSRTIAALTTSRADFSHLYWPLRELQQHPDIDLKLIATAAHLSPEFGLTVEEIRRSGLEVQAEVECLLSSDSDVGMAKTIGLAVLGLTDVLARWRPDCLLLIADRYELLAPATVALALRIPIAHIEGGDVSEGAIDDAVRHALTKMSHLHFTTTVEAEQRVLALGEESWRVHRSGAPSLDHLERTPLPTRQELERELKVSLTPAPLLIAYHPVTIHADTLCEADEVFQGLDSLQGPLFFCFPNADAGSREIMERARELARKRSDVRIFVNLSPVNYWGLLRHVAVMVGNSSSGIMETASLGIPTVNIGMRQQGRVRPANIIDADPLSAAIKKAVGEARSESFRASLLGLQNPYGDGHAAERIRDVLLSCPLGEELLLKKAAPL